MSHPNLIAGEWVHGDDAVRNINPSDTGDVVGEYERASAAQVDAAIEAARRAAPAWARTTVQQRADLLEKVGVEILARRDALADLLAREEGKTLADATGKSGGPAISSSSSPRNACASRASGSGRCGPASMWRSRASRSALSG